MTCVAPNPSSQGRTARGAGRNSIPDLSSEGGTQHDARRRIRQAKGELHVTLAAAAFRIRPADGELYRTRAAARALCVENPTSPEALNSLQPTTWSFMVLINRLCTSTCTYT